VASGARRAALSTPIRIFVELEGPDRPACVIETVVIDR
jgi:hypothetical protein